MKLKLDESTLWNSDNVEMLKKQISARTQVPVEVIEITRVDGLDDGMLEIYVHAGARTNELIFTFEDQVYIAEKVK
eukprot:UN12668